MTNPVRGACAHIPGIRCPVCNPGVCPTCGTCPTCGKRHAAPIWPYPSVPYVSQPARWVQSPYPLTTTSGGAFQQVKGLGTC